MTAAAIGARGDYLARAAALLEAGADCLFIDIAHGHSKVMEEAVGAFRKQFGSVPLVCGNVATAAGARFMRDIGADAVKVGVGPGRGCRTRLETAAGVPQLQAIRESWEAVGDALPVMADGGVRTDKDIFLALACGATTVMLGSALSGTDEAPGRVIEDPVTNTKKKIYRGMTSPEAVLESLYEPENAAEADAALDTPPEGQEIQVPYKGKRHGHSASHPRPPAFIRQLRGRGHLAGGPGQDPGGSGSLFDPAVRILPPRILRTLTARRGHCQTVKSPAPVVSR